MQPISILGSDATELAELLVDRLDGRVAVVTRTDGTTDGGVTVDRRDDRAGRDAETVIDLGADGTWTGRGTIGGFDDVLDRLAPDHDYLVATGFTRLRVPTVLVGHDAGADDVPGTVIASAGHPAALRIDELIDDVDAAEPWITLEELVDRVRNAPGAERSGAIATFTGRVRAKDAPDDDRTTHLAFERYEGVARERMDAIADELTGRDGVFAVRMHHRSGVIEAGEDIVFVVVLAGHRDEAFRTVKDGIDRLKDEVPIFKKETTEAEEFWVHQRE